MKRFFVLAAAAAVTLLTGCGKENLVTESGNINNGAISLSLSKDGEFTATKALPEVSVADFFVKIYQGDQVVKSFARYADVPEAIELVPGNYAIEAGTADKKPAGFNQPVFYAKEPFKAESGKLTAIHLVCHLSNVMVTLKYTAAFGLEIADDFEIVVSNDKNGSLIYNKSIIDAGTSGFFEVSPLTVTLQGRRKSTGAEVVQTVKVTQVNARDHFTFTFDAKPTGGIEIQGPDSQKPGIDISWDVTNKDQTIIVPGADETPVPPAPAEQYLPTITGDGIETPIQLSMSADNANAKVDINMATLNGKTIKDIVVSITSDPKDFENLVATLFPTLSGNFSIVDFSDPQGAERKEVLGTGTDGLGLIEDPDTKPIKGKTAYTFKIGSFMGALAGTGLSEGTECRFTITLTDSEDKQVTKACVVKLVK